MHRTSARIAASLSLHDAARPGAAVHRRVRLRGPLPDLRADGSRRLEPFLLRFFLPGQRRMVRHIPRRIHGQDRRVCKGIGTPVRVDRGRIAGRASRATRSMRSGESARARSLPRRIIYLRCSASIAVPALIGAAVYLMTSWLIDSLGGQPLPIGSAAAARVSLSLSLAYRHGAVRR